jgi:type VI secretion system protein ImpG
MDKEFTDHYNEELRFLKELGAEFAADYPKIAGRLGMQNTEVADPYVERLLEGFAFLTARIRFKMDAQLPQITQQLLNQVMPTYSAPLPSMMVTQFQPDPAENVKPSGFAIPRHSSLFSMLGKGEQTRCEYRTAHEVMLHPIELTDARYVATAGGLDSVGVKPGVQDRAGILLHFRTTGGLRFNELELDDITLYLQGSGAVPAYLYEQLFGRATSVWVTTGGSNPQILSTQDTSALQQVGFSEDECLLPSQGLSLSSYRLLQEYFALPERFSFVRIAGLAAALAKADTNELEIIIVTNDVDRRLDETISAENFQLFCTPAVNLFPKRADRIQVTARSNQLHILADRTRPLDFEVYDVTEAKGFLSSAGQEVTVRPLYEQNESHHSADAPYYVMEREQRLFSSKQQRQGPRSSYLGTECFLSLVDRRNETQTQVIKQLSVSTLCTNRDLPIQMALGQGATDFDLQSGAPILAIRSLTGIGPPRQAMGHGDTLWKLVNSLSVNYLSLVGEDADPTAIKNLLRLFADTNDPSVREQIDGIRSISSRPITHRLPTPGPICFGRGLEITITMDETAFQGIGAFLLGAVLERFIARYVTLNTFTRTKILSTQRGELVTWPNRVGIRDTL